MTMSLAVVVALKDFLVALKDFLIAAIALRVSPEHQIDPQTLDIRPWRVGLLEVYARTNLPHPI